MKSMSNGTPTQGLAKVFNFLPDKVFKQKG
jgi:hypothetical protein